MSLNYQTVQPDVIPLNRAVRLLASNEDGLVAIEKPAGALSHPNDPEDIPRSVVVASYDYQGEYYFWKDDDGVERRVWLVNRLDSPTSGVLLLALNEAINETVKQVFATHKATKIYFALVRHVPRASAGTWSDKLKKDLVNGTRVIKKERLVPAKSGFQVIKKPTGGFPVSLLKLAPITGRTHQLRVQCKKHGHPIVGDRTYGHFGFNKEIVLETGIKRMMLHSTETVVNYTYQGKVRSFRARSELPEAFDEILRFRPGMGRQKKLNPVDRAVAKQSAPLEGRRFKGA